MSVGKTNPDETNTNTMTERRMFPMIVTRRAPRFPQDPCPRAIPWDFLAPHEQQALKNHDQSLEKLASRGGLSGQEAVAIVRGQHWREGLKLSETEAACILIQMIDEWESKQ